MFACVHVCMDMYTCMYVCAQMLGYVHVSKLYNVLGILIVDCCDVLLLEGASDDEAAVAMEEIVESMSIMTKASEKVHLKEGVVEKKGHSAAFLMWPKLVIGVSYMLGVCEQRCMHMD